MPAFNISVITDLIFWIENNLEKPLSLDDLANKSGYCKRYLLRIFRQYTGVTPGFYIRCQRLSRVADELRLTEKPIINIVIQYQFKSQQNLTRCFKSYFNTTPAAYRSRNRKTFGNSVAASANEVCSPVSFPER